MSTSADIPTLRTRALARPGDPNVQLAYLAALPADAPDLPEARQHWVSRVRQSAALDLEDRVHSTLKAAHSQLSPWPELHLLTLEVHLHFSPEDEAHTATLFQRCFEAPPREHAPRLELAWLAMSHGYYVNARQLLAPLDGPDIALAHAQLAYLEGQLDTAHTLARDLLPAAPPDLKASVLQLLTLLFLTAGKPDGALFYARQHLHFASDQPGAYILLAQAIEANAEPLVALGIIDEALTQFPGDPSLSHYRATLLSAPDPA